MVYVTCSIFMEENEDRLAAFLKDHNAFSFGRVCGEILTSGLLGEAQADQLRAWETPEGAIAPDAAPIFSGRFFYCNACVCLITCLKPKGVYFSPVASQLRGENRMRFTKLCLSAVAIAAIMNGAAHAQHKLDQKQEGVLTDAPTLAIGGASKQQLSQSFQPGENGEMTAIALPIGCSSGDLVIEIHEPEGDYPTGGLHQQTIVPASELPNTPSDFVFIELDTPMPVGHFDDRLAFVLKNETGSCGILAPVNGDPYAYGSAAFNALPNSGPPNHGWRRLNFGDYVNRPDDLAFRTYLKDDAPAHAADRCFVPGFGNVPADPYSGACRCFQDPGGRETRCGALHPDFFIERVTPFPLPLGKIYKEEWRFTPLTQLDGPVRMTLEGGGLSKPVYRDFGFSAQAGETETVIIKIRAPKKPQTLEGVGTFEYDMNDIDDESLKYFGIDRTIAKEDFGF